MPNSPPDKSTLAAGPVITLKTQLLDQYFLCTTRITHEFNSLNNQAITVNTHIVPL